MISTGGNDFDSDCSTPTRYLERRQNKQSTDQSFFSTINSPVCRDKSSRLSFDSVASTTMTSIESSSCSFEEPESRDMKIHSRTTYFKDDKRRNILCKREPSHDGSTVFFDACDSTISEERYLDAKSQASSVSFDDQSMNERLCHHPKNKNVNRKHMDALPYIQPLYQQDSLQSFDQSYDGSYHVHLGLASTTKSSPDSHIHDMSVHLQCSSDLSDLYSPSGVETILKPNSFDFSSIWNHLMNWRGKSIDNTNFCSTWTDSCRNPDTPLNMKQYYNHMHPFDHSYNASYYNSPVQNNYGIIDGMKTEKRKNTVPNGDEPTRNFYIVNDNEMNRNEELNVHRANLDQERLNNKNFYYSGFDGKKDYYVHRSPAKNFDIEKDFGATRVDMKHRCIERVKSILNFDESDEDKNNDVIFVKSPIVDPSRCLDSEIDSMESVERNIIEGYLNCDSDKENAIQNQGVRTIPRPSLKQPVLVRNTTSGTSTSLSPSNTMQTNGTRHRRNISIGCNTFTAESLVKIFDSKELRLETSPTTKLVVPKTIKTVKKKNRLGIQDDDDISPLDDDEELRPCFRNRLSQVDVAVEDDSQCSPIHRKNEAFDFTNYSISTDLFGVKSDDYPIATKQENSPMTLKRHNGQYLPVSDGFRKEMDYKVKDIIFEGWVAFSKGTRLIDALLEDEKNIQRKDLRYIVLQSGKLHVYASKTSYENHSEILNKKVLKLRSDFRVNISSLSNQHGKYVMIRDNADIVKCAILPVNLNKNMFCDDNCSEVVSITEFRKQRHKLFAIHPTDPCEDKWFADLSQTVPFEQNTAALWIQFALDAAIRMREMHKHSRTLSCCTFSSRDTFSTRSTCSTRNNF